MAAGLRQRRRAAQPTRTALIASRRLPGPVRIAHTKASRSVGSGTAAGLGGGRQDRFAARPQGRNRKIGYHRETANSRSVPFDGVSRCRDEASGQPLAVLRAGRILLPDVSADQLGTYLNSPLHAVRELSPRIYRSWGHARSTSNAAMFFSSRLNSMAIKKVLEWLANKRAGRIAAAGTGGRTPDRGLAGRMTVAEGRAAASRLASPRSVLRRNHSLQFLLDLCLPVTCGPLSRDYRLAKGTALPRTHSAAGCPKPRRPARPRVRPRRHLPTVPAGSRIAYNFPSFAA